VSDISLELEPLFNPASVAVIGASNSMNKWGFSTWVSILQSFPGEIYPVNNREETILGRQAHKSILDVPGPVDLAVFVVPAPHVAAVMEECVEKGVRAALVISAGFADIGEEGRRMQEEVVAIARPAGIRIVGPNCMGFWSASSNLRAFMFPIPVMTGPIGFVSQGGNIGASLVVAAHDRGVGFHRYVSCGCAADLQIEDYIEHFADDPDIKVILAYIEGLVDGRRFVEKVRCATAKKPVIVMKPGRTQVAMEAIVSHSGALSGSDDVYDAAFREAGAIRVDSSEELLDLAVAFLTQPLPASRNIAIVTPGGSYGVVCADACASLGLNVIQLRAETIEAFNKMFPPRWSHHNPVDPAGDRNYISYLRAPSVLLELPEVGSLVYTGFASFSAVTTNLSFLETEELEASLGQFLNPGTGIRAYLEKMEEAKNGGDDAAMARLLEQPLRLGAQLLGAQTPDDIERFVDIMTSLFVSGEIGMTPDDYDKLVLAAAEGTVVETARKLTEDFTTDMLLSLVMHWIRVYAKPVITTTFTEDVPTLTRGLHQSYPSGERAAKVLAGMVQYQEYLAKEGIWNEDDFDRFAFTLFEE
jgi:succinyl-CoA synthetase alpha subunit